MKKATIYGRKFMNNLTLNLKTVAIIQTTVLSRFKPLQNDLHIAIV